MNANQEHFFWSNHSLSRLTLASVFVGLSTGSSVSYAAQESAKPIVEEVIVQGELRRQSIDTTSLSVTVIDPANARQTQVNHLEEVLGWIPNVNSSSGASRARFLQIRGIGERGQFSEPLNTSVGTLLDGVDLSGVGTVASTYDVEQIEVFRGPQGTLYGANALAGIVNVVSNNPTEELYSRVDLDVGNFGALGVGGVISGAFNDQLAGRLAVRHYGSDGFLDNEFLDIDDANERDELTIRSKLRYEPNERSEVLITAGFVDIDNGYDAFSLDNDRNTQSDEPGFDRQETIYGSVRLRTELNNGLNFDGYVAHADSDIDYGFDEDWTFVGFDPNDYSSFDRYQRDRKTTSADFRLLSNESTQVAGLAADWVFGVFALTQDVDLQRTYTFLEEDFFSDYGIDRFAGYGEFGLQVTDAVRVAVGLRLEHIDVEYEDSFDVSFGPSDTTLGGRFVVEYTTPSDNLIYGTIARGFKSGGVNTSGTLPEELRDFDLEELWNFEIGFKGSFAEGRGTLRTSAFLMKRDDVQSSASLVLVREDGSSEFIDFISNAPEGTNYGLEVETQYALNDSVTLFASVGLLEAEFDNFVNAAGNDLDGRDQAQAPNYQFFAGVEFSPVERWFARIELEGRDSFFFSDSHNERSESYELLHASIGYEGDFWRAKVWARNLTDQDTFVRGFQFGNDPRDLFTTREFTQLGEPRRVGLSVGVEF